MIKVSVMYPNKPGARFDHAYYLQKHMPDGQGTHGLSAEVLRSREGARWWQPQ